MKFESKYGLGELVYVVYHEKTGILIELDTINEIVFKNDKVLYFTENCFDQLEESQIYPLEDFEKIKFEFVRKSDDECTS